MKPNCSHGVLPPAKSNWNFSFQSIYIPLISTQCSFYGIIVADPRTDCSFSPSCLLLSFTGFSPLCFHCVFPLYIFTVCFHCVSTVCFHCVFPLCVSTVCFHCVFSPAFLHCVLPPCCREINKNAASDCN